MTVFDPGKMSRAMMTQNKIGAVAGGVVGFMTLRKFSPTSPWYIKMIGVIGGMVGGAYAQQMIQTQGKFLKSSEFAKK